MPALSRYSCNFVEIICTSSVWILNSIICRNEGQAFQYWPGFRALPSEVNYEGLSLVAHWLPDASYGGSGTGPADHTHEQKLAQIPDDLNDRRGCRRFRHWVLHRLQCLR